MDTHLPLDPLGHIKLSVSNFQRSYVFYALLFNKLGFKQISNKESSCGWVTKEGFGIWISQAKFLEPKPVFSAPGFHHLCLKASSPSKVDEIHKLLKNKAFIFDPPRKYPAYTEKYYTVFIADPDGLKIEVAFY